MFIASTEKYAERRRSVRSVRNRDELFELVGLGIPELESAVFALEQATGDRADGPGPR